MVYWTLDYFKILYNEYTASGVNVREFCRARGIKENRFYYWIKMLKSQALSALDTPRVYSHKSWGGQSLPRLLLKSEKKYNTGKDSGYKDNIP